MLSLDVVVKLLCWRYHLNPNYYSVVRISVYGCGKHSAASLVSLVIINFNLGLDLDGEPVIDDYNLDYTFR